ncbi:hypothetical protein BCV69DRAFT_298662 [Microstroma glucosiphilum]|uniref:PH-response regulator protein palC n=1 Tax=Pseudomicrostroma glucosiphilum TaxID=1684307 RepID=A0A316UB36_9BASI|nr:hypothetical protein BCV69DRAFT_298662 [Pseudomicrostroma glucosiphilum]PWN21661.1 hypothetical protein BCV69DRAFT_298662 [Pseudomicrostroma glucosiphilum]
MYLHPLPPPPDPVDFSSCLIPTSTSSISTAHLAKATHAREGVRSVLSNARLAAASCSGGTPGGTFEVKLVSAIEDYLPHLIAIYNGTQTDDLVWRAEAWFAWPAPLSPSSPTSNKLNIGGSSSSAYAKHGPFASSSLRFELDNLLILYSLALSNLALLQSISVGSYEYTKSLMDTQRKDYENILKRGVTFGKKAVEVVQWMIRDLDAAESNEADGRQDWNEEWQSSRRRLLEGLQALHQLPPTLISLRLLLSPATCTITSTQHEPPPLPKGHPSASLLAKLCLEVPRLVEQAQLNLQSASGKGGNGKAGRKLFGGAGTSGSGTAVDESKLSSKFKRFGIGKNRKEKEPEYVHRSISPSPEPALLSSASTPHRARPTAHESRSYRGNASSSTHPSYPGPSLAPVTSRLFKYLDSIAPLYRSISLKYLALSVGESGEDGSGGRHAEAVVYLRMAKGELDKLTDGPSTPLEEFIGKDDSKSMRARLGRKDSSQPDQLEHPESEQNRTSSSHPLRARLQTYHSMIYSSHTSSIAHILNLYKRLNDSVSFQVLPSVADLSGKIPTPRGLLTFDQGGGGGGWTPPKAAFGREGTGESGGQGFLIGAEGGEDTEGAYAGKGAYY